MRRGGGVVGGSRQIVEEHLRQRGEEWLQVHGAGAWNADEKARGQQEQREWTHRGLVYSFAIWMVLTRRQKEVARVDGTCNVMRCDDAVLRFAPMMLSMFRNEDDPGNTPNAKHHIWTSPASLLLSSRSCSFLPTPKGPAATNCSHDNCSRPHDIIETIPWRYLCACGW